MAGEPLAFVHRFVPAKGNGREPVLLLLHGTGGDEADLLPWGREIAPGAALLSVRGKVSEGGMPRLLGRLSADAFDLAELRARTHELADFTAAAGERHGFEPERLWAVGYSNGANMAAAMMLLRPGTLAGAVLLRAMIPLVPEPLPDLSGSHVFISAGRRDPLALPEQASGLAAMFEACGAGVTLHWTEGGHALEQGELDHVREWLSDAAR